MLIDEDGRGFVQRIDRYPDMDVPCDESIDPSANQNCEPIGIYSSPRFERGAEDTVTFDAPDLGLPAAMWISPEDKGMWYVDEVELRCSDGSAMAVQAESQRRGAIVSYPCDDWVGGTNPDDAALELRPNGFFKMTSEQRTRMREDGLREYGEMKFKMLTATGAAVALGCLATASMSGGHGDSDHLELMRSFASGGGVGLIYLYMLTRSVDTIGPGDAKKPFHEMLLDAVTGVAASGPVRLLMLALMGTWGARYVEATDVAHPHYGDFFAAVLGFFSYKAGVLIAGFSGVDFSAGDCRRGGAARAGSYRGAAEARAGRRGDTHVQGQAGCQVKALNVTYVPYMYPLVFSRLYCKTKTPTLDSPVVHRDKKSI